MSFGKTSIVVYNCKTLITPLKCLFIIGKAIEKGTRNSPV